MQTYINETDIIVEVENKLFMHPGYSKQQQQQQNDMH